MPERASSPQIRLSGPHQRWIYAAWTLLAVSGGLWLIFHYCIAAGGAFGEANHPLEAWWLRLHGAAAMLALVSAGSVLPVHVGKAWRGKRNRTTGWLLVALLALLGVTGYLLYYFADESSRPLIGALHWVLGLAALPVVAVHAVRGRAARTRRRGAASGVPGGRPRLARPRLVTVDGKRAPTGGPGSRMSRR